MQHNMQHAYAVSSRKDAKLIREILMRVWVFMGRNQSTVTQGQLVQANHGMEVRGLASAEQQRLPEGQCVQGSVSAAQTCRIKHQPTDQADAQGPWQYRPQ